MLPKNIFSLPKFPADLVMYSIEGIDGSGKTTQAKLLVNILNELGINAVYATNPSESLLGRFLRQNLSVLDPWQRVALFVLDMLDVIANQPPNTVLLWDRYLDSTIVSNKEIDPSDILPILEDLPLPRKTFFLNMTPEEIIANRRGSLHDHSLDIEWQSSKYTRYQNLIEKNKDNFCTIDGNLTISEISQKIAGFIISDFKNIQSTGSVQKTTLLSKCWIE